MIEKNIINNFNAGITESANNSTTKSGNFFAENHDKIFEEFNLEIDWEYLEDGFKPPLPETASVSFRG